MHITRDWTERPRRALLQPDIGFWQQMYRIGGSRRRQDASLAGGAVGIPLFCCRSSNRGASSASGTVSGGQLRQRPDRYTIRAGRNLPDKEFRYLRTVIVTAAVYWGFNSELALLLLTFQHRAGVTPYTSSFDLAESCVFDKQSPGPIHCGCLRTAPYPEVTGSICRVP